MFASALITLREGLEAALIVGILLSYLGRIGHSEQRPAVWRGVGAALIVSIIFAGALQMVGATLEGRAEEIFEGAVMFLAVAVLTYMVFWMRYQGRHIQSHLEQGVRTALTGRMSWAVASLAFFAVLREGVETVLFLSAAAFAADGIGVILGGLLGLAAAIGLGWLVFKSIGRVPLGRFFALTSLLLLFVAAGLTAHGVHEFEEAGLLPSLMAPVWDINHILPEKSFGGSILTALFGYNGNPSLVEVVAYVGYWIAVLLGVQCWLGRMTPQPALPA